MKNEEYQYILRRISATIGYLQDHWNDDIARQYLIYLQNVDKRIKSFERKRLEMESKRMEIESYCEEIINGNDDRPKIRKR